jgi:hypothetical protein
MAARASETSRNRRSASRIGPVDVPDGRGVAVSRQLVLLGDDRRRIPRSERRLQGGGRGLVRDRAETREEAAGERGELRVVVGNQA